MLPNSPLLDSISSAAIPKISECGAQGLANLAWSCATILITPMPLLDAIASEALRPMQQWPGPFKTQEQANTSWAFAKLNILNEPLMEALASASIAKMNSAQPQDIGSTVWSFAKLMLFNAPLLEAIASAAIPR